jgi:hypothetical protein
MKIKFINALIFTLLWVFFLGANLLGTVPDGLQASLKQGNAKETAKFLNSSVELNILGKENVCSKTQAEQIIKSFFDQHPVTGFTVIFEGGKDASQYAIGKLNTTKGIFRVNLLIKNQLVTQLRIEEDNGD